MLNFKEKYDEYRSCFERALGSFCEKLVCSPEILSESMLYSLNTGGKRIRPVIMYAVGDVLGVGKETLDAYAVAMELIHTYSLIHDDLPEMDNDDFRRGKPSNHKVFGTGNAVLAGDGLLNTAYSLLFSECFKGREHISASKYICDSAGIDGMIAGQSADLMCEHRDDFDESMLEFIYEHKTVALIAAATTVPVILCGGKYYPALNKFGRELGYLFQLTDDILDVEGSFSEMGKSIGKDEGEGKLTAVKLYGLDDCKLRADVVYERCVTLLDGLDGDTEFLKNLVKYVRHRIS